MEETKTPDTGYFLGPSYINSKIGEGNLHSPLMKVGKYRVPFPKGRSWCEGLPGTREGRDKDRHRNPFLL